MQQPPRTGDPRPQPAPMPELSPFEELAVMDHSVKLAALDEEQTCFDPDCHPKAPHSRESPVTDVDGNGMVAVPPTPVLRDPPSSLENDLL